MPLQIEHTDTYGGESNYSWVRRWWTRADLTDRQQVRLAKRLTGLTGTRCGVSHYGDMLDIRPRGICHVVFVAWADDGHTEGTEVDAQGNPVEETAEA